MIYYLAQYLLKKTGNKLPPFSNHYLGLDLLLLLTTVAILVWDGLTVRSLGGILLVLYTLVISLTDFCCQIIPDRITLFLALAGLAIVATTDLSVGNSLIGGITGFAVLYIVATIGSIAMKRQAMGGGDIKLAGMLGIFVGWQGILLTIFLGSLLALMYAVMIRLHSKEEHPKDVPFGPFLATAGVVAYFLTGSLVEAYLLLLGS